MNGPPGESHHTAVITPSMLVGLNTRLFRRAREWSTERLSDEMAVLGYDWGPHRVEALESGTIDVTMTEVLGAAAALGVAPQLLLYPPAGVRVALSPDAPIAGATPGLEDELIDAETHILGAELAEWIWSPDDHPNTHAGVVERRSWERSQGEAVADPDG